MRIAIITTPYCTECRSKKREKHGLTGTRIFNIFFNMKQRCYNQDHPQYKDYGGRGIDICDSWLESLERFYNWSLDNGYNEELTIDRIDNDKGYNPKNCRWTTQEMQNLNQSIRVDNKTGYTGVYYNRVNKKYIANINYKGERTYLGGFKNIEEALLRRNNFIYDNDLQHKIQQWKGQ